MGTQYLYSVKLHITWTARAHDAHLQYFLTVGVEKCVNSYSFLLVEKLFKITFKYVF